ncbi:hypothetical protein M0L20_01805 [Spirosoma sp. RP8]|uniref:Uncharacterized protein n=1 Tax=Spirosoma liriopis TaxID=2937440 RepID=A0ABT0HG25_9BACT|nr:hypothetical protein [Spirosoma liriopis]MCK8490565.1 hypothetical protein [Spirosoma liriopis]
MNSNIRINHIYEQCGKEFEARKITSKTGSDACAKKAYKVRKRTVQASNEQVRQRIVNPIDDMKEQQFLTVNEPTHSD